MKYSTIIGLLLLAVGLVLYILQEPDYSMKEFYIGGFIGLGVGLFLGGIMGFLQKKRKKVVEHVITPAKPVQTIADKPVNTQDENSGIKL